MAGTTAWVRLVRFFNAGCSRPAKRCRFCIAISRQSQSHFLSPKLISLTGHSENRRTIFQQQSRGYNQRMRYDPGWLLLPSKQPTVTARSIWSSNATKHATSGLNAEWLTTCARQYSAALSGRVAHGRCLHGHVHSERFCSEADILATLTIALHGCYGITLDPASKNG